MEVTDKTAQYVFWRLWPSGNVPLRPDTGLPDKLVEDRFYDLFLAMWDACYDWEEVGEADQERFRKFLLENEVFEREEADLYVGAAVAICLLLPIRKLGWLILRHMIVFLSQHGRLSQP
jgi:hypothetical protein